MNTIIRNNAVLLASLASLATSTGLAPAVPDDLTHLAEGDYYQQILTQFDEESRQGGGFLDVASTLELDDEGTFDVRSLAEITDLGGNRYSIRARAFAEVPLTGSVADAITEAYFRVAMSRDARVTIEPIEGEWGCDLAGRSNAEVFASFLGSRGELGVAFCTDVQHDGPIALTRNLPFGQFSVALQLRAFAERDRAPFMPVTSTADAAAGYIVSFEEGFGPCNAADLAPPLNQIDLADIAVFVTAFTAGDPVADVDGDGLIDLDDIAGFVGSFQAGCPY